MFLVSLPRTFARDARDCEALFSFPARGNNEGFHCAMLVKTSVVAAGLEVKRLTGQKLHLYLTMQEWFLQPFWGSLSLILSQPMSAADNQAAHKVV